MSYGFSPEYEQLVIALSCAQPTFWSLTGRHMLPAGMGLPASRLLLKLMSDYSKANGDTAPAALSVREQLLQQFHDGKIKASEREEAQASLEEGLALIEDTGITAEEASAVASQTIITEHQRIALEKSVDAFTKGEDLTSLSDQLAIIKQIGVSAQTTTIDFENALADIEGRRKVRKLSTGIDELDLRLGGVPAGTETVFVAGPGGGKCNKVDTPIRMYDGTIKPVQDVLVGDLLAGPDGQPRKVLGTTQGTGEMYMIVPAHGMSWGCNGPHVLVVQERSERHYTEVTVDQFLEWPLFWQARAQLIRVRTPSESELVDFHIRPIGVDDYYGFQVEGDGLYLLGDFTLTHNSMCLSQVASNAMLHSLNVAIATLEVSRHTWNARLIGSLLNIPITPIEDCIPQTLQRVRDELHDILPIIGNCAISYFTPQATTVREILAWVHTNEQRWRQRVDVLVIDYADKLAPEGKKDTGNSYEGMRDVYERLRIWAEQNSTWVFTASQAKGKGQTTKTRRTDVDDVADSMHKSRVCDLMITLDMTETNGERQVAMFVAKNRLGPGRFIVGPFTTAFEVGRLFY